MALFIVIAPSKGDRIEAAVAEAFPDNFYRMNDTAFVVSTPSMTSRQVSDKLGISRAAMNGVGPNAPAAVFTITKSFWGVYPAGLWEWIQVKFEGSDA